MDEKVKEMLDEIRPECDFAASKDYVLDGLLDSFDIVSLVSMLEDEYDVRIDGLEIVPENFATVEAIVSMVEKAKEAI